MPSFPGIDSSEKGKSGNRLAPRVLLLLLMSLFSANLGIAAPQEQTKQAAVETKPVLPTGEEHAASKGPSLTTTHHTIHIHGETLSYTATTGTLHVENQHGEEGAEVFFVAYAKDGENDLAKRPITFAFNGGPGASSVWLHMGAMGPKRVPLLKPGEPTPSPYELVDNDCTWLDITDLVFIDPVGTGFSRATSGKDPQKQKESYYGVKQDVQIMGQFIRLYTTRYQRWNSPKFVAGESYGTVRAVLLANQLLDRYAMNLNGLILISAIMNFQAISFDPGNDLPYAVFLPTYALTAAYHQKSSNKESRSVADMAGSGEQWSMETYWPFLLKGDSIDPRNLEQLIDNLSAFTGLSREYIERHGIRVGSYDFAQELLGGEHRTLGLMDSRNTIAGGAGDPLGDDPSLLSSASAYASVFNDYVRRDLAYENDAVYEYLSTGVNEKWDWKTGTRGYLNVSRELAGILRKSPAMKVFVASGYYDLNTPYFGTTYSINHLGLDSKLHENISHKVYEGGHQMYTDPKVAEKLKTDAAKFIWDASGGNTRPHQDEKGELDLSEKNHRSP